MLLNARQYNNDVGYRYLHQLVRATGGYSTLIIVNVVCCLVSVLRSVEVMVLDVCVDEGSTNELFS